MLFLIIIATFLYYLGFFTKEETLPLSKEFFSAESSLSSEQTLNLKGLSWIQSKIAERKPLSLEKRELDQLYQLKLDRGIHNLSTFSLYLTRQARQARQAGDLPRAFELATYASKFSPDLPQPYFEIARSRWQHRPFHLHEVLLDVLKGYRAKFRNFPATLTLLYRTFYHLSNALLMAFILFGIVVLWKYLSLYFHDIRRNLTQEISSLLLNGFKVFLLFLPFFLRFDLTWSLLFWSILLWGYIPLRERQFIVVFLILLVYLPFFLRTSSTFLNGPASDILLEMSEANHENWDKRTEEKLRAWSNSHSGDSHALFTLGLIEKRQGRYSQAEEFYLRAIDRDPNLSQAYSNLGNVYLAQKQIQQAIASYQRAIELDPEKGSYYYNLYRAYSQETFLSGKSDKAFQKARQLAPDLVQHYSTIEPTNINRLVIDEVLTPAMLWSRFWEQYIGKEGLLYRLFRAWFERVPSALPFLAPILFLAFLIGMTRYTRTKRFLTRCPMCGVATHRFYLGTWEAHEQEFVCFNCYRLFVQKEKLHPKIMEKKALQVQAFQKQDRLIGKLLSYVFVGFGDLWRGHSLKGLLLLTLYFVFLLKFLFWSGRVPGSILQHPFSWEGLLSWGSLFILFYFIIYRKEARRKPEFEVPVK